MLSVTATTVIAVTPQEAWDVLCDTTRYAEYVKGTDAVTRTDGPAQPGSTYDEVNPILGPWKAKTKWTVVEFDPPRRMVHTTPDLPLTSTFSVIIEVAPEGDGTRLTQTLEGAPSAGPLGGLFAKLMRSGVDRDNRKTVENLAALLEREHAAAKTPA